MKSGEIGKRTKEKTMRRQGKVKGSEEVAALETRRESHFDNTVTARPAVQGKV